MRGAAARHDCGRERADGQAVLFQRHHKGKNVRVPVQRQARNGHVDVVYRA
jgi:hypothetical protein